MGYISSWQEYASYKKVTSKMSPDERKEFDAEYRAVLAISYFTERQKAIASSQKYAGNGIVLIQSPEELYDCIIAKHGQNYPSREEFRREFQTIKKQIKEANTKKAA